MIETGKKVKFHYTLKVGDRVVDSSLSGDALEYVHGKDSIISGLEKGLEGRQEGDKCTIKVLPDEGYGPIDPKALVEIDKDKIPSDTLELGAILSAKNENGDAVQGVIQDIRPETVMIDFNHPLAGKVLTFDVEILNIRSEF